VYWVVSKSYCYTYVDTFIVRAGIQSPFDLGRDTMICGISGPLLLEAPNVPGMFRWQDGHAGKSYLVKESGVYWLEINDQGRISSDTIKISLLDLTQDIGEDLNVWQNDPIDLIISAKLSEGAEVIWTDG